MKTWVRTVKGVVVQVIVAVDKPAGKEAWLEYPYPSDLGGPGNIAGMKIKDFNTDGNLPKEEPLLEE